MAALAATLMLLCTLVSLKLGHRLERDFLLSTVRVVIQLALLGLILNWLFSHSSIYFSVSAALIMTVNSAIHSSSRIQQKYPGLFLNNLLATALSIWPLAIMGTYLLGNETWWSTRALVPLIGMMLGNTLNGLSMGIDHFTHDVKEKKEEVLSWLAIGATTQEATKNLFRRSLKIAMTPTINSMLSMGLVSIPGMMTGQLLSGTSPVEASVTQMILMFLIASGTYFGTLVGLTLSRRKLFNHEGQLCWS